ncbi:MAG: hypothetical protein M3N21_06195 [Actinomycetota bacterium]|nr:hypothetical protein [Actinomycetota bacterium]
MNRLVATLCLALSVAVGTAGCGQGRSVVAATVPVRASAAALPTPTHAPVPPVSGPHFATPEAAMRYLADAWNRDDVVSLKHVTDPAAREQLQLMRSEATHLALAHCEFRPARRDYECFFTHEFPKGYKSQGGGRYGSAEFTVGPARKPGWYMTYFVSCGG